VSPSHTTALTSAPGVAPERAAPVLSEYLTQRELACELRVCKRTLDRWHASRIGPPRVTIGRKPMYRREAVAQWLRKREKDPAEEKVPGRRARKR
jgi:hypothetical protein